MQTQTTGTVTHLWIGKAQWQTYGSKEIYTGAHKHPVESITVTDDGADGDEQGNLKVHGGPDKALLLYNQSDYDGWSHDGYQFGPGNFFENITVEGIDTPDIHVADTLQIGEVTAQVSQIRRPCTTLSYRWSMKELPILVQNTGRSGFYVRILKPGVIRVGDRLDITNREPGSVSLSEVNRVMNVDRMDEAGIRRLIEAPGLPEKWVKQLKRRLTGYVTDESDRLGT